MYLETSESFAGARPVIHASIRKGRFEIRDVRVLDLTLAGCMVEWHVKSLREQDQVFVGLPRLGKLPGVVLWIEENRAGILFDELLHQSVFENLWQS